MLKAPSPQQYALEMVTLEELVPRDHLVRKIDAAIDFEFIREAVSGLYSATTGRPAIDPVRLFKIMLLGYLFGIPSERRLVKEIQVNVAYRWFLGMGLTDKVIDASTLSQNRIRRFNDSDIYQRVFDEIVRQAIEKGLVGGKDLYTDSTHLKANANKNRFTREERMVSAGAYLEELNKAVETDRAAHGKKPLVAAKAKPKTKMTRVSKTDPESGFMSREGKPEGFHYLDHRTVDGQHGIIVDTHSTPGNVHDSQPYISRLDRIREHFEIIPEAVGLDAGYFTAMVCSQLEQREIIGVFGYRRPSGTPNKLKKKHFTYTPEQDQYCCPMGKTLNYRTTGREGYRYYHANTDDCRDCPRKMDCTQSKSTGKILTRHIMESSKERAHAVRLSEFGRKKYRRRSETVERSFADAKQHHNHRYARFRGQRKVQMQCLFAACAQNMKKMALLMAFLRSFVAYVMGKTTTIVLIRGKKTPLGKNTKNSFWFFGGFVNI